MTPEQAESVIAALDALQAQLAAVNASIVDLQFVTSFVTFFACGMISAYVVWDRIFKE